MDYATVKTPMLLTMYGTIRESLQYDEVHPPGRYGVRDYLDLLSEVRQMEHVLDSRGAEYERIQWS